METTKGYAIDGMDDQWTVDCPKCDKEFNYSGFFDSSDITNCKCGCSFTTTKVWIDDTKYIE